MAFDSSGQWLEKALMELRNKVETGLQLDGEIVSGFVSYCKMASPLDAKEYLDVWNPLISCINFILVLNFHVSVAIILIIIRCVFFIVWPCKYYLYLISLKNSINLSWKIYGIVVKEEPIGFKWKRKPQFTSDFSKMLILNSKCINWPYLTKLLDSSVISFDKVCCRKAVTVKFCNF